jgi:hypothetical protein
LIRTIIYFCPHGSKTSNEFKKNRHIYRRTCIVWYHARQAMRIFFLRGGKSFAVHFIRRRKAKKQKRVTKYLQYQTPWNNNDFTYQFVDRIIKSLHHSNIIVRHLTNRKFKHISIDLYSILKDRKRRPEGVNGSRKISSEIFGRCPKITPKHTNQIPWCPRPKRVSGCSEGTQWDTTNNHTWPEMLPDPKDRKWEIQLL